MEGFNPSKVRSSNAVEDFIGILKGFNPSKVRSSMANYENNVIGNLRFNPSKVRSS